MADSLDEQDSLAEQAQEKFIEHCKQDICYLEKLTTDGKSHFITTEEDLLFWGIGMDVLQKLEDAGIDISVVSNEEYNAIVSETKPHRINYRLEVYPLSWKCSLGIAGGIGLGGVSGIAGGPLGIAIGGIAGGLLAASGACF